MYLRVYALCTYGLLKLAWELLPVVVADLVLDTSASRSLSGLVPQFPALATISSYQPRIG
jgi:hypothetical protein